MSVTDGLDRLETSAHRKKILGKVADLIESSGIELDDVGRIEKIRLNSYQSLTKNADGEAEIHDLEASSVLLSPKWAEGPAWPVVQPAKPVVVKPPAQARRRGRKRHHQAVILPDPQIGFRRFEDGTLDPFHDDRAMAVALKVTAMVTPERIVNLGDFCDLPAWGKYLKEPAFYFTTQATLDRANLFLGQQREVASDAAIDLLEGNHDWRMTRGIIENAAEAYGLRVANTPESWPILSIPNLLQLDELGVTYHSGYPANELWLNDQVRAIHGVKVKSGGSTASAVVNDDQVSTIFGHIHRLEMQHKTRHTRQGPNRIFAASPGCLARVDGAVPSVKGGVDVLGRPLVTWENWQQGMAIVSWYDDGPSNIDLVEIIDGQAWFQGELLA